MPGALDALEPEHVPKHFKPACHIVITSDGPGRPRHGVQRISQKHWRIRARRATTIEILTRISCAGGALEVVVAAKPDMFNPQSGNVPSRYLTYAR